MWTYDDPLREDQTYVKTVQTDGQRSVCPCLISVVYSLLTGLTTVRVLVPHPTGVGSSSGSRRGLSFDHGLKCNYPYSGRTRYVVLGLSFYSGFLCYFTFVVFRGVPSVTSKNSTLQ